MIRKLLDISVNLFDEAASNEALSLAEVAWRGRGNGRQFLVLDTNMVALAHIRIYEKVIEVLDTRKYGWPDFCKKSQDRPYECWTRHADDPATFQRIAEDLVDFIIMRREGLTGEEG